MGFHLAAHLRLGRSGFRVLLLERWGIEDVSESNHGANGRGPETLDAGEKWSRLAIEVELPALPSCLGCCCPHGDF